MTPSPSSLPVADPRGQGSCSPRSIFNPLTLPRILPSALNRPRCRTSTAAARGILVGGIDVHSTKTARIRNLTQGHGTQCWRRSEQIDGVDGNAVLLLFPAPDQIVPPDSAQARRSERYGVGRCHSVESRVDPIPPIREHSTGLDCALLCAPGSWRFGRAGYVSLLGRLIEPA